MASPTSVVPSWPRMTVPRAVPNPLARPKLVHPIARFAFWSIFLLSLTDALALLVTYLRTQYGQQFELAIYPVTFAVMAAIVLVFSNGRQKSAIFLAAWVFWLTFFLGGFLGSEQATAANVRYTLQVTLKPWMSIVGLPWLALRVIPAEKVPRLVRASVLIGSIGAILAFVQVFIPGFMQDINYADGRGSGFWINPNGGGIMCALLLFLSLTHPFQRRWLNWTTQFLLIVGVGVSFSRAALLSLIVGWVVYGIAAKRFRSLIGSAFVLVLFVASMIVALDTIETVSPDQARRVSFVRSFLQGDWSSDEADNRTGIWQATLQAVAEKRAFVFGLGHGSMGNVAGGLAPHNAYLYVLGNSGIIALFGLFVWQFVIAQQGWSCARRETRAALLAIATIIALVHLFDSSFIDRASSGAVLACVVLAACFGKSVSPLPVHKLMAIRR
jgi:hypothetical protein